MLDSAGIDPTTLLNVTAGGSEGIGGDVELDENGRSSLRSYFDVFSEPEMGGDKGWADEGHGTASHHIKWTIIPFCIGVWICLC